MLKFSLDIINFDRSVPTYIIGTDQCGLPRHIDHDHLLIILEERAEDTRVELLVEYQVFSPHSPEIQNFSHRVRNLGLFILIQLFDFDEGITNAPRIPQRMIHFDSTY